MKKRNDVDALKKMCVKKYVVRIDKDPTHFDSGPPWERTLWQKLHTFTAPPTMTTSKSGNDKPPPNS